MSKKLSNTQKAKNKALYKQIRKVWNTTDKTVGYKDFKNRVIARAAGTGETIKEAAKKYANTRQFKSAERQGIENLLNAMKKDFKGTYNELRRKGKWFGRGNKGEHLIEHIGWDDKRGEYVMTSADGSQYIIKTDQSPKNIYLLEI